MCTLYELFYSSIIQRCILAFLDLDQFLHLHKCDPDSCAEAEVSGNGWQWYKPLHVRPEMHTQSKEQQFNINVSMFDTCPVLVDQLCTCYWNNALLSCWNLWVAIMNNFLLTHAGCFQAAFIYSHHSWWSLCILVGDWPSLLFSWFLCLACTTWYLPSCQRALEKMLVTFLNLAWARFRCAQPTTYEISTPMLINCGTVWCTTLSDYIIH